MLNATDLRNIKFSNAMNGYKKEEVEILLDKIEVDYGRYEKLVAERNARITQLENEVEELKKSQNSIQNVLLSAQRLADQIIDEAKQKSEKIVKDAENSISLITEREKQLTSAFEQKASERKQALEREISATLSTATVRKRAIENAAADSVSRQQALFDKLKLEISAFKADITKTYKQHLELIASLPDDVPTDPEEAARLITADLMKKPEMKAFEDKAEEQTKSEAVPEDIVSKSEPNKESEVPLSYEAQDKSDKE